MESIQALRERRAHFMRETRNLLDQNPVGKWNAECQKKYDDGVAEIERIEAHMERIEKLVAKEAEKAFPEAGRELARISGVSKAVHAALKRMEYDGDRMASAVASLKIYDKWLRGGDQAITAEEWTQIRNTMSVGTNTQGGYTVQSEVAAIIIDALKDYSGMRQVAETINTSQGNPLNFPTSDGTAETGELIGENTTATALDPSFNTVALTVYKYSSKVVACPIELLQDSQVDMEAFIRNRLRTRLGRIQNTHFTTGSGAGQPNGVVTAAGVGKTGLTGQTLTVIYDDFVDLIDSVDIAYQGTNCKFMFAQSMRKVIRKIKDTTGRPIWTPSYEAGLDGAYGDNLLGYGVQVNNDMAAPGANNKTIAFGDFSYYKIRQVMEVTLFRFTDSAYMKLGQVGFLAWMRAGGNLVDANAVKVYQHSAT